MPKKDVLFLLQFFFPEYISSAMLPFQTAKALSDHGYRVDVLCGYPKEYVNLEKPPKREIVDQIQVTRIGYIHAKRKSLLGRLGNYFSLTINIFFHLIYMHKYKCIVVYSNPPFLPLPAVLASKLYKAKLIFVCYDVYPEIAVATRAIPKNGVFFWIMSFINRLVFDQASSVVALSSEMKMFLLRNRRIKEDRITVIPNWFPEEDEVRPVLSGRANCHPGGDTFYVSYIGNMGTCQNMQIILDAACILRNESNIRFILAGHGNKVEDIKAVIEREHLGNIELLGFLRGREYGKILDKSSCFIISLEVGLSSMCCPSKVYSYYSAERPLIAYMDKDSDIVREIQEYGAGYSVTHADEMAQRIIKLSSDPFLWEGMSRGCAALNKEHHHRDEKFKRYRQLIQDVLSNENCRN